MNPPRERSTWIVLVATIVVAAAVRFASLSAVLPYVHHSDEPTVERVVMQVARNPLSSPRFFNYPSFVFYAEALVLKVYEAVTGLDVRPVKILTRGTTLTQSPGWWLVARSLTVLCGTGIAALAALLAIRASSRWWTGAVAGAWVALSLALSNDSRVLTPDTYSAFFALAALASCTWISTGASEWRAYVIAGAFVGLSAGCKYTGALAGVAVAVTHLFQRDPSGLDDRKLLGAGLVAFGVFLVTTPFAVFDYSAFINGLLYEWHHYDGGHPGAEGNSLGYYAGRLWDSEGPRSLFIPLAFLGCSREQRGAVAGVAAFALIHFALISRMVVHFERNLVPFVAPALVLAALGLCGAAERVLRRPRLAPAVALATAALLSVAPVAAIGRTIRTRTVNPRATAERWIDEHLPPKSRVVLEGYSPWVDPTRFAVFGIDRLIDVTEKQLVDARIAYAILVERTFGRYYEDRARYQQEVRAYDAVLRRYCVVYSSPDPKPERVVVLNIGCIKP